MANLIARQQLTMRNTNLYANGYIIDFPEDGESLLLRNKIKITQDSTDRYYTVNKNERLDLIAYKEYGSEIERAAELWWVLADVNNIFNPFDLTEYIDKAILIPNIQKVLLLL